MFTCRYIINLLNVYLLYIQPIIGLYLVSIGLWMFYAPDEQTCTEISIGLCTVSAIEILKPVVFILLGVTNITGWYFTELQPKLRREGKYKKIEAGVKPEDFVK